MRVKVTRPAAANWVNYRRVCGEIRTVGNRWVMVPANVARKPAGLSDLRKFGFGPRSTPFPPGLNTREFLSLLCPYSLRSRPFDSGALRRSAGRETPCRAWGNVS